MESSRCQERHVVPTIDEPIRRPDERRDVTKVRSRREHDASHRRFLRRKQHATPTHNPYVTVCHHRPSQLATPPSSRATGRGEGALGPRTEGSRPLARSSTAHARSRGPFARVAAVVAVAYRTTVSEMTSSLRRG
jgi:hypothetical protein